MMLSSRMGAVRRTPQAALMLLLITGSLVFTSCDKLLPSGGAKWVPPEQRESQNPDDQFRKGRLLLLDGKSKEAAALLTKLDARPNLAQPLHNWITLYAGMAELLSGREEEARALFAKLVERGPFVKEGGSSKMADFFVDLGKRLSADATVPSTLTSNYGRFNYESLALFLYGMKNADRGEFPEALDFFRQFTTSEPKEAEPFPGFNVDVIHARQYASNLLDYEDKMDTAERALQGKKKMATPEETKEVLAGAKAVREKIKGSDKLLASLDEKMTHLSERSGEQEKVRAEEMETDAKLLPEAKEKWAALVADYQFADARQAIVAPALHSEKAKKEQDLIATRTSYLENFKFYLIQEISINGYDKPITLKNGDKAPGITRLDDKNIYLKGPSSGTPVPWSDLPAETIYGMAKSLVTPTEPADARGFRKWHLGFFAGFIGKEAEAKTFLKEAAELNPAYQAELPQMLEVVASR